jgi:NTE family protein
VSRTALQEKGAKATSEEAGGPFDALDGRPYLDQPARMMPKAPGRIGLALGSGAARGWAHVGVIRALEERGLKPEIVCGASSGAVVGLLYAAGRLDTFEAWGRALDWRQLVGYFDLTMRGGLIKARKLLEFLTAEIGDLDIATLRPRFGAVATDLESGREVWLREGSALDALRASMALPGLVAPIQLEGRWLLDGGLVNAVPVSLCRAMGADTVIAVDLASTLLRRRFHTDSPPDLVPPASVPIRAEPSQSRGVAVALQDLLATLRERMSSGEAGEPTPPSIYEVVANSINIMQVRITRSRLAGDPADLLVTPRLEDFALLDFDRAAEAIEEGKRAVARALSGMPHGGAGSRA